MFLDIFKNKKIPEGITQITGPPKSGKRLFLYHICSNIKKTKRVCVLDCEANFSGKRLNNIISESEILENIILMPIESIYKQLQIVMNLQNFLTKSNIDLIIINGLTTQYRSILNTNFIKKQKLITMQLAYLKQIKKNKNLSIIISNQISGTKKKYEYKPVAKAAFEYYVDKTIFLSELVPSKNIWKARCENDEITYFITKEGIKITSKY